MCWQLDRSWFSKPRTDSREPRTENTPDKSMATQRQSFPAVPFKLRCITQLPRMRALYWDGDVLYASRGYELFRSRVHEGTVAWEPVGRYHPEWWRKVSSASRLSFRLFRDGFHALNVL